MPSGLPVIEADCGDGIPFLFPFCIELGTKGAAAGLKDAAGLLVALPFGDPFGELILPKPGGGFGPFCDNGVATDA